MFKILSLLFIIIGCSSASQQTIEKITAEKLLSLQKKGVLVVDIRTDQEYSQEHIPDVLHVNFNNPDFSTKMGLYKQEEAIVIYCARGGRSGRASALLETLGFKKIYDYTGGFSDWKSKGLAVE